MSRTSPGWVVIDAGATLGRGRLPGRGSSDHHRVMSGTAPAPWWYPDGESGAAVSHERRVDRCVAACRARLRRLGCARAHGAPARQRFSPGYTVGRRIGVGAQSAKSRTVHDVATGPCARRGGPCGGGCSAGGHAPGAEAGRRAARPRKNAAADAVTVTHTWSTPRRVRRPAIES